MQYTSKFDGHKIVMEPIKITRNEYGEKQRTVGKHIRFTNGQYVTSDPKEIEFLDRYMAKFPDELEKITAEDSQLINTVKRAVESLTDTKVNEDKIIKAIKGRKKKPKKIEDLAPEKKDVEEEPVKTTPKKRKGRKKK